MEQTDLKTINIPIEYKSLFDNDWREAAVYGGRMSLKSHTVARVLLIRARQKKTRVACFREFQNSIADSSHQLLADLIKQYGLNDFQITNNSIVNTVNGSDFLFKGLHHNEQSVKSIEGIDIAWVEEAQTISAESLEVLTPTVRKPGSQIIYTYNRLKEDDPVHNRLVIEGRPNTLIIKTDYRLAKKYGFLPKEVEAEVESDRINRPKLYAFKWLGEPVSQELRIYKDWNVIDSIPHEARLERYGLDFGYSNDPTSIVAIYYYNGGYILDEICYQKGLSNKQIADIIKQQEQQVIVVADSAEPKSIDEIMMYGITILPAEKGQDSVRNGIALVQSQRISVTNRSINLLREYRNYLWMTDKNGKTMDKPEAGFDHCFAPESLVHTIKGKIPIKDLVGKSGYVYSRDGRIEKFSNVRPTRTNADVLDLHFEDGSEITVTPDHLMLLPNGEWISASLLSPKDMIQLDIYDKNIYLQWFGILQISIRQIFQRACEWYKLVASSLCLDSRTWRNSTGLSYSPQGRKQRKQHNRQSRINPQTQTPFSTYDTRKKRKTKKMGRDNQTTNKEVAFVQDGDNVAQISLAYLNRQDTTSREELFTLPQEIFDKKSWKKFKVLLQQLQDERKAKKITRITRGRRAVTYNLDVENTHCLAVDGVIAHNSMDSLRYGLASIVKTSQGTEAQQRQQERFQINRNRQELNSTK